MPQLVYISNIQKFCTHDGPGIRTTVFFKGCPMSCQWCANPETKQPFPQLLYYKNKCSGCGKCVAACENGAIVFQDGKMAQLQKNCNNCGACAAVCPNHAREIIGKRMTPQEIFDVVNQDKVFYEQSGGGVTFSGGEALIYTDFIHQVALKCKAEDYTVAIETCGCFDLSRALKIMNEVDLLLFDIKILDDEKHIKYCGQSNKAILKNFDTLIDVVKIIPRIPIISGINDTEKDIALLCDFLCRYKGKIEAVHILPYHNLATSKYEALDEYYQLSEIVPPSQVHMKDIKRTIESCGLKVYIGG